MTSIQCPCQPNAWVGLSSSCSMCDCVLLLLPHLERERVTGPVCVQARCHKVPKARMLLCVAIFPHLRARMGPASTQSQSNAWVGLSSRCSMCYCVLPLLPHLRVRMNTRVSPRVGARVVSLFISSMTATQSPHQSNAWFGLSSCSSMCSLQPTALTSQMPGLGLLQE